MSKEIEAKFYIQHLALLRDRLIKLGARVHKKRTLERNWRFDTIDGRLTRMKEVLRLREAGDSHLTYKSKLNTPEERLEIEFGVDNIDKARDFLLALGYRVICVYEKYREIFQLGSVEVMLDELPFGSFVEIEGPTLDAIKETSGLLNLDWERRVSHSYLGLFEELRHRFDLPFNDATFANFADLPPANANDIGLEDAVN
jgi:adenylate cyclase class 2